MILNFLTETAMKTNDIANQLGVQEVTTDQMIDKSNKITTEVYNFITAASHNIVVIIFVIAIIFVILAACFHKKGLKGAIGGLVGVMIGMALLYNAPLIIGWVIHIVK